MLNILLNTHSLLDYHRTGISYYTWHLLDGMLSNQDIDRLYAFTGQHLKKYKRTKINDRPKVKDPRTFLQSKNLFKKLIPRFFLNNFESFCKTSMANKVTYLEPNFIVKPFAGTCIATLHDLTCLRFPELQPPETVAWFEAGLRRTLMQTSHIISVSEFTRQEAIHFLGISPQKITTVHNGVSREFKPRLESDVISVLKKYKLQYKQFILTVSTLEPRKNLDNLLKGYLKLPSELRKRYPLVVVGAVGWKVQDFLDKVATEHGNQVQLLGYLPQPDLLALFSSAKAFCYLSTYEGFGLPVLEAMASGLPVLTSEDSAMAEFSRQQALLVNPLDVEAIGKRFEEILLNDYYASQALSLADFYRQQYSWERCIDKTVEVIKINRPS